VAAPSAPRRPIAEGGRARPWSRAAARRPGQRFRSRIPDKRRNRSTPTPASGNRQLRFLPESSAEPRSLTSVIDTTGSNARSCKRFAAARGEREENTRHHRHLTDLPAPSRRRTSVHTSTPRDQPNSTVHAIGCSTLDGKGAASPARGFPVCGASALTDPCSTSAGGERQVRLTRRVDPGLGTPSTPGTHATNPSSTADPLPIKPHPIAPPAPPQSPSSSEQPITPRCTRSVHAAGYR
jgi:hypothetical protein